MSLSSILDLISKALSALQRFKDLILGTPSQAANAVVADANASNKTSADIARSTETTVDEDLADAQKQGDADLARLHDADSLREQQELVERAIERANEKSGADSVVRRK